MNPMLLPLPYDSTGTKRSNLVLRERYDLKDQSELPNRVIVLNRGYFYAKGLTLVDASGYVLKFNRDYMVTGMSQEATRRAGKLACSVIVITNTDIMDTIYVKANMVGGIYSVVTPTLLNLAQGIINPDRPVDFNNIQDLPNKFRPNGHLQSLWSLYGFEDWITRLKALIDQLLVKSANDYEALFVEMTNLSGGITEMLNRINLNLADHIANKQNPHEVTRVQVELDKVADLPIAVAGDVGRGAYTDEKYLTPYMSYTLLVNNVLADLDVHVRDKSNPHKLNAAKVSGVTPQSVTNRLTDYHNVGDTVKNALLFNLKTRPEFINDALLNNQMTNVTTGYLPLQQITPNALPGNPAGYVLASNKTWVEIAPLVETAVPASNAIYAYNAVNTVRSMSELGVIINTTYPNAPIGTMVIITYNIDQGTSYTGNGSRSRIWKRSSIFNKTSAGWIF